MHPNAERYSPTPWKRCKDGFLCFAIMGALVALMISTAPEADECHSKAGTRTVDSVSLTAAENASP